MRTLSLLILLASACSSAASLPLQQPAPSGCAGRPQYRTLDFWVGEWKVTVNGSKVGDNRIEKVLGGCAILEHWTSAGGGEGKSLFFVDPLSRKWKQVWVTDHAHRAGGTKEKAQVEEPAGGGLRFQGEITRPDGSSYLDRTTLTPLEGGRVRQHIEVSRDGGASWTSSFDAIYVPKPATR